jgi:hypothetical protein
MIRRPWSSQSMQASDIRMTIIVGVMLTVFALIAAAFYSLPF